MSRGEPSKGQLGPDPHLSMINTLPIGARSLLNAFSQTVYLSRVGCTMFVPGLQQTIAEVVHGVRDLFPPFTSGACANKFADGANLWDVACHHTGASSGTGSGFGEDGLRIRYRLPDQSRGARKSLPSSTSRECSGRSQSHIQDRARDWRHIQA